MSGVRWVAVVAVVAGLVGCSSGEGEVTSREEPTASTDAPAEETADISDLEGTDTMFGRVHGVDLVPFATASEDFHIGLGLLDVTSGRVSSLPELPGDPIVPYVFTATDGVHVVASASPCSRNFVRSSFTRRAFLVPILLTAALAFSSNPGSRP